MIERAVFIRLSGAKDDSVDHVSFMGRHRLRYRSFNRFDLDFKRVEVSLTLAMPTVESQWVKRFQNANELEITDEKSLKSTI